MKKLLISLLLSVVTTAPAVDLYETAVIDYENRQADNRIEDLQKKIDLGEVSLEFDTTNGYLSSLLNELNIPLDSQTLVFSKTSFHRKLINSRNPRALYFDDNIYLGWTPGAELLEIGVVDRRLGAVFYTMKQRKNEKMKFQRDDSCLSCHVSGRTGNEPGFFIRSIFPDEDGEPIARAGSDTIDHTSDLEKRWGGWFVTGEQVGNHRGNAIFKKGESYDNKALPAQTLQDLKHFFNPERYPANSSDIEALLVLEHQARMHNRFTQSHFQVIKALDTEVSINKALGETGRRPFTQKLINNSADHILEYMLFCDEAHLDKIQGNTNFLQAFSAAKPKAKNGDSLYTLKFDKTISELPCSWLIYSDSFSGLNPVLKHAVLKQLKSLLTSKALPEKYIHLRKTRQRIHQVLLETLPEYKEV